MPTAWQTRSLSSAQKSPLARRIMRWLQSHDPIMTQVELARKLGVKPQALSLWMLGKSEPKEDNLVRLADILGCQAEDIREDIEASRSWMPPMAFDQFVLDVLDRGHKEQWPDLDIIERYLMIGRSEVWNDQDSVHAVMMRSAINDSASPLRKRALAVAVAARDWSEHRGDQDQLLLDR